ncbi:gliding motility-associated C-terminal domain-containing protein [Winogradskyella litorisediminis]|uniref:Gliding motility-associated C-terminal domain-containing protein n=1 Tax=Winogradskyella litorisediminis TaxID=1156618 RepID=A0ABW3N8U3_9FLAO
MTKAFEPETIIVGEESLLTFTITNLASNPMQTDVMFLDNLPLGVVLAGSPFWENSNGSTGNFIGDVGDSSVGVSNLTITEGTANLSFSVLVTSDIVGAYTNTFSNFSEINNADASQASATITVIEDMSDVDIEVIKTVSETEINIGEEVTFTITATNLGTTTATSVEILEQLPLAYQFISATTTVGVFDEDVYTWTIESLAPNTTETLELTVRVISSQDLVNVVILNYVDQQDRNEHNNESSASVDISNCLQIAEGISPNNDDKNDVLIIPCIEDYQNNSIKIFNRYGTLVFQQNNYENNWKGQANIGIFTSSEKLPIGTYYYILQLNNSDAPLSGFVYLNY